MTAKEAEYTGVLFAGPLTDSSAVECRHCGKSTPISGWTVGCYWCETCEDDHWTVLCPECDASVDSVYQNIPLKVTT